MSSSAATVTSPVVQTTPSESEVDDVKTAIEGSEGKKEKEEAPMQRATQIRIKQRYNCQELEITQMRAPFLGFSIPVRFQSRARVHTIKIIQADAIDKLFCGSPVPYS